MTPSSSTIRTFGIEQIFVRGGYTMGCVVVNGW
jgi:hypothetical protein